MVSFTRSDLVNAAALLSAIERQLPGLVTSHGSGDWFAFYDPDGVTVPDQRFPFLTLVTGDRYDAASDLDRDADSYRVNLGVGREAYEALFGAAPREPAGQHVLDTGADYAARDTVLPHPFYAPLHWVCVVNPGPRTRDRLAALVDAAYAEAARHYHHQRHARE
jgi:Family of unknown function (DUF6194)